MPTYEYKCRQCGDKFELKLGIFQNRNAVKCPKCGWDKPDRVFTPVQSNTGSCGTSKFR